MIIIIIILLIIIAIETNFIADYYNWNDSWVLIFTLFIVAILGPTLYIKENTISPIDVYRGDTTLEITYKDSIAIDSTVVWKN